jgi:hypothetical protein
MLFYYHIRKLTSYVLNLIYYLFNNCCGRRFYEAEDYMVDVLNMTLVPQRPFQHVDYYSENTRDHPFLKMEKCIKKYVSACDGVKKNLEAKIEPIGKFRTNTNFGRTVATGAGVTSTVLTITGVALAAPTFGASLSLTATGIALGAAAGVTTGCVETIDYLKTKEIFNEIELILRELEGPSKALDDMLKEIKLIVIEMAKFGYTENDAFTQILIGVSKGVVDIGRIGQNAANVGLVLAKMPIGDGAKAASSFAQYSARRNILTEVATNGAVRMSASGAEAAASAGGKALQSTSGVLMGLTVGLGVAFTVADIALLVVAWNKKHKTAKAIEKLINTIKDEINKWENFSRDMRDFIRTGQVGTLYQQIQNMSRESEQREIKMRQEFEECLKQVKQEAEERERQMRQELEERERRMKQELEERDGQVKVQQNEMVAEHNEMKEELAKMKALLDKLINNNNL